MVKALIGADVAESAAAAVKAKLTSMGVEEVTKLLSARGLGTSKSKNIMVETLLAHEADVQLQLKAYEAKRSEVAAKEKDALQKKKRRRAQRNVYKERHLSRRWQRGPDRPIGGSLTPEWGV